MSSPRNKPLLWLGGLILGLSASLAGRAVELLGLQAADVEYQDWRLEDVSMQLLPGEQYLGFRFSAKSLSHPALPGPIEQLDLRCEAAEWSAAEIRCGDGRLSFNGENFNADQAPVSLRWLTGERRLELGLWDIRVAGGRAGLNLSFDGRAGDWQLTTQLAGLDLANLARLAGWSGELSGRVSGSLSLNGKHSEPAGVVADLRLGDTNFADSSGEFIGEGIAARIRVDAKNKAGHWSGEARLTSDAGAALTPWVYLETAEHALQLHLRGDYASADQRWTLQRFDLAQTGLIEAGGSAAGQGSELQRLRLKVPDFEVAPAYRNYLQPLYSGGLLSQLELAGRAALELEMVKGAIAGIDARLDKVSVEHQDLTGAPNRFALYEMDGRLQFDPVHPDKLSHLHWAGGHLFETIDLGETDWSLRLRENGLSLADTVDMPVLDGALSIDVLDVVLPAGDTGTTGPTVDFSGILTPISMPQLSRALGWPAMQGQVSGVIPRVRYADGEVRLEGNLLVRVFEGDILLRNLRIGHLFSVLPELAADVEMHGLELEALTSTFDFGRITGRVDGRIDKLRLENWKPVSFDARIATAAENPGKRRISQRAVDNISNLGGAGVSGAMSRTFLRFFEDFGYAELGISCRLQNGVCEMGGVEDTADGYYLVKGGGLPRIDVKGYSRRTDWDQLLSRLQDIAASEGPVIQ